MRSLLAAATTASALFFAALPASAQQAGFSPYVDDQGTIRVPENYRTEWVFLGTWALANGEGMPGDSDFHNVFTQPDTVEAFRETGKFPDGAVLVKELLTAKTDTMTTGEVSYGKETEGWFVMIKDTMGRFKGNGLWGSGWGWALIYADDPSEVVTTDYKAECIPCHVPAKMDDWVYVHGYPVLNK